MLIVRKPDPKPVKSYECNAIDMPNTLKPGKNREKRLIRNAA